MNAIQKALERSLTKHKAYVGICSGDKELTEAIIPMLEEALTALRGIEAGDVEKLKEDVCAGVLESEQDAYHCLLGVAYIDRAIDHLHANGYLPQHKLPVIDGLEYALRCVVEEDGDNPIIKAAQEYARRSK